MLDIISKLYSLFSPIYAMLVFIKDNINTILITTISLITGISVIYDENPLSVISNLLNKFINTFK